MSKDCQLSMSNSFPGSQLSAGGSGSANRGQMPRKGILKQSASANQLQTGDGVEKDRSRSVSPKLVDSTAAVDHENKQYNDNLPQPAVRQSKKSKIPKLSVTWWETTAPYPEDPDEQELPAKETANTSSPQITMDVQGFEYVICVVVIVVGRKILKLKIMLQFEAEEAMIKKNSTEKINK
ncbi:conserved hypothetical protein [Trichinella spiralis]|uniref:hypothetical protein n=1 Tax=Trichinella spiralis TaxID=6334 RepID=UPI0001EFB96A|nr:conserved hypothetical protein [Trichinella spiralis]